jgi:endo-1,4-beta-mannosidase
MPNGKSYDMSNVDQRQQMYEESIIYYLNTMVQAIKQIDPELLVTEGIFTMKAVGKMPATHKGILPNSAVDSRYPPTADILARSNLDFLDIHLYHTTSDSLAFSVKQNLVSVNYYLDEVKAIRKTKPFILGEFGSFKHVDADVEEALVTVGQIRDIAMKDGFKGYLYWTFDTFEQKDMYNAMYGDGLIYQTMSSYAMQLENVPVTPKPSPASSNWLAWGVAAGVAIIGGGAWLSKARKSRGGKK